MTADDPLSHSRTPLQSGRAERRRGQRDVLSADDESAGEIGSHLIFRSTSCRPMASVSIRKPEDFSSGELYCAVASRIGEGAHPEAIVEALAREFPSDKIDEAIQRLLDRRFAVPVNPIDDTAAGYWASLGLTAKPARKNLSNTSVQIESMGAAGAEELDARCANSAFGYVDHTVQF